MKKKIQGTSLGRNVNIPGMLRFPPFYHKIPPPPLGAPAGGGGAKSVLENYHFEIFCHLDDCTSVTHSQKSKSGQGHFLTWVFRNSWVKITSFKTGTPLPKSSDIILGYLSDRGIIQHSYCVVDFQV